MRDHDDKYLSRAEFEPGTPRLQALVDTKELYQWNASFDRFRGISVHRSPVQADSASRVVGYFRFHCLH